MMGNISNIDISHFAVANVIIMVVAYIIDRLIGEFISADKHPVAVIGELVNFSKKIFYGKSVFRGLLLVIFVLLIIGSFAVAIEAYLYMFTPYAVNIAISSVLASVFIAHKMLRDTVAGVLTADDRREAVAKLVSRDTETLNDSDVNKAAIESYAENLSDAVIAPMFYLLLLGLPGIIIYKTVNTMDSMIGYKNEEYEKFGKVAAILDDILNYIPARITAILIMIFAKQKNIFAFYKDGKKHDSPNAGLPITAMALAIGVKLGGNTSYFGEMKEKATFGNGRELIEDSDIEKALKVL